MLHELQAILTPDIHIKWQDPRIRLAAGAIAGALFLGAAGGGYYWYTQQREARAQMDFSESIEGLNQFITRRLQGVTKPEEAKEQWQELELSFATAYDRHRSSSLAPFMQVFQAQAAANAGQPAAAYKLMQSALKSLSSASDYYELYTLYAAVLGTGIEEHVKDSVAQLERLAKNNSVIEPLAKLYLGQYRIANNEVASAVALFKQLAVSTNQDEYSAVVAKARELLKQYGSVDDQI